MLFGRIPFEQAFFLHGSSYVLCLFKRPNKHKHQENKQMLRQTNRSKEQRNKYMQIYATSKNVRIAISWKWHFRSPKRKRETTFQYKVLPKTWENSPQNALLATQKLFFGHCFVQNARFLRIPSLPNLLIFLVDWGGIFDIFWP